MKAKPSYFFLIDCNNFYVSCERVFNPKLEKKPVVVLSNNDGCVISRSNEVKKMGIPMGAPIFKYQDLVRTHSISVFSANFPLYADMSKRVMHTLSSFQLPIELYSIDEAFLHVEGLSHFKLKTFAQHIVKTIQKNIGIPVSIGIGRTKTLAKASNYLAKRDPLNSSVCMLCVCKQTEQCFENKVNAQLQSIDVGDVWGIGRSNRSFLFQNGIYNAVQLKNTPLPWIQKHLHKPVVQTVKELNEESCISLEEYRKTRKTIITSRSFGKPVTSYRELSEAVSEYTARAGEKLREEKLTASTITVYITTNKHKKNETQFSQAKTCPLPAPTADTRVLLHTAHILLKNMYKNGLRYKKALIILSGLTSESELQDSLFYESFSSKRKKTMQSIDEINTEWGSNTISFASQGIKKEWQMRRARRSPRYTTNWSELPVIV